MHRSSYYDYDYDYDYEYDYYCRYYLDHQIKELLPHDRLFDSSILAILLLVTPLIDAAVDIFFHAAVVALP